MEEKKMLGEEDPLLYVSTHTLDNYITKFRQISIFLTITYF